MEKLYYKKLNLNNSSEKGEQIQGEFGVIQLVVVKIFWHNISGVLPISYVYGGLAEKVVV